MKTDSILKLNDLKWRNILALLGLVMNRGPLSRVELARAIGCDNTTVSRAVRDLMSRGVLIRGEKMELEHGRPREQLKLNPNGAFLLGISLEPTQISGVLTNLRGESCLGERVILPAERSLSLFLESLGQVVNHLFSRAGGKLAGVGVSTFGSSLEADHAVLHSVVNFPELSGLDLRRYFEEHFGLHPFFADMMLCRMLGELRRHPESGHGSTVLVHLGRGIGMSIAIDGQIVFDRNQHGGELGHTICEPDGLPCSCGRRGCLETRCSASRVLEVARSTLGIQDLDLAGLGAAAWGKNDVRASAVVEQVERYLGIALANLVNVLSPDRLVLDGALLELGEQFCRKLEEHLRSLLFDRSSQALQVYFRSEENRSGESAALLAGFRILSDPVLFDRACPVMN